jgi:hypothetical protein
MIRLHLFFCLLLSLNVYGAPQRLTLQAALSKKLVMGNALSLGGHQGACIELTVTSLTKDALVIIVEPGRRLNSMIDIQQDLLVVRQATISLKGRESKRVVVSAYCCQSGNSSPRRSAKYSLGTIADTSLVRVAQTLDTMLLDPSTIQSAVWAVSDNKSTGAITAFNDNNAAYLRRIVAGIKNEPVPWYSLVTRTYVYRSGMIDIAPIELNGTINIRTDSLTYATCYLLNNNGMPEGKIMSQWLVPGTSTYELKMPVKGVAAGRYTVEIRAGHKVISALPLEI